MIRCPPLEGLSESDSVRVSGADAGGEEPSFPWGAQLRAGKGWADWTTYLLKAAQTDGYHDTQKHLPNRE